MIYDLIILVWMHFFCDFVLQTRKQAESKSSDTKNLAIHVLTYSVPFVIFGWVFAVVNYILHFATDYCSSRMSKKFYTQGNDKMFWIVIGADQALHKTALILTYITLADPIFGSVGQL